MKVMFGAGISHGLSAAPNPFSDVKVSAAPRVKFAEADQKRIAFKRDHVAAIFAACDRRVAEYEAQRVNRRRNERLFRARDMSDAFRLLAFIGMRSGELIQLRPSDVITVGGRLALNITDEADSQSLKTAPSLRVVPVHPDCVAIVEGLLKRAKGETLFPSFEKVGMRSQRFQGAASKYVRHYAGIPDKNLTTHSLRHRWRVLARGLKMPPTVSRAILGHEIGRGSALDGDDAGRPDQHDLVYNRSKPDFGVLAFWIEKIKPAG